MSSSFNEDTNEYHTQNSAANTINLPNCVQSVMDSKDDVEETHLKMIEIKKKRIQALTALAKSQSILANIDVTIAEFELKLELIKLRMKRRRPIHAVQKVSETTKTSKTMTPRSEQPKSLKCKISLQNPKLKHYSKRKLFTMETASSKSHPSSGESSYKETSKTELEKQSIKCSIPFQNVSRAGKHISRYLSYGGLNTEEQNTETYTTANTYSCTPNSQSVSDQSANSSISTDLPIQPDRHSSSNSTVNAKVGTYKRRHICISMLRVAHGFNFSVIPGYVVQNRSQFVCIEGDHVGVRKQFVGRKKMIATNRNRLITIYSDTII